MEQLNQRVRMKVGTFELEIEGPSAYEEFHKLQHDGFAGLLSSRYQIQLAAASGPAVLDVGGVEPARVQQDLPPLPELAIREVAGSEREWVLVYSLYATDRDGKTTFATSEIWNLYKESGRDNRSRQSNLSLNIKRCVESEWLTKIKADTYALKPAGQEKAVEIVSRTGTSRKADRKKKATDQN